MTLLVLRPEPGASATARRTAALGHSSVVTPLFRLEPVHWSPPAAADFDAVMMTSASAARLGGQALADYRSLPIYAVGAATAAAARAAGFAEVRSGTGDGAALVRIAVADGIGKLLHLAGREHRPIACVGVRVEVRTVYAAEPADALPLAAIDALEAGAVALLHSPRAAALFAKLVDAAGLARETLAIAAISAAACDAAGPGWRASIAADDPSDAALLAAAARLCDQDGR